MIYIIEGAHAVGKTTFAKSLGIEYRQAGCSSLDAVKRVLIDMWGKDVACDRLFLLPLMGDPNGESIAKEINDFLKYYQEIGYIKCYMLICDKDIAWEREQTKEKPVSKKEFDDTWDYYTDIIPDMDAFEVINTTSGLLGVNG